MSRPARLAIACIGIAGLLGGPTAAQSPSPSLAASSAPSFTLDSRGETADDLFRLAIQTDDAPVTTLDVIHVQTTWSYLGAEPVAICTGGGGPVIFEVEQLDGFFDPGGGGDDSGLLTTVQPGEVQDIPFQKSGGYDASDPLAPQYAAWFDDPLLRLPAGIFRITAHAQYAVDECAPGTELDASVVVEVTEVGTASPSPSSSPVAIWTPIDLELIPWQYYCFLRFDPSALVKTGGVPTDDPYLRDMVRSHGPDARLLMVDDRFALIGVITDGSYRSEFPLYQYELEKFDGRWTWSGEGDCRPWAALSDPLALGGHWRLDPAFPPPTRRSRVLHALVVYSGCPSAVRVRGVPRVVTTDAAVAVVVPVVNRVNSDACSPGPWTPVTIRLSEPLGDRALYDAGVLPMRRVRIR